jgi:hypothetical protein
MRNAIALWQPVQQNDDRHAIWQRIGHSVADAAHVVGDVQLAATSPNLRGATIFARAWHRRLVYPSSTTISNQIKI